MHTNIDLPATVILHIADCNQAVTRELSSQKDRLIKHPPFLIMRVALALLQISWIHPFLLYQKGQLQFVHQTFKKV